MRSPKEARIWAAASPSALYRGTVTSLVLLFTLFLIQAWMPLAFSHLGTCWLIFCWLSTSTARSFSTGQPSWHISPQLEHCLGLLWVVPEHLIGQAGEPCLFRSLCYWWWECWQDVKWILVFNMFRTSWVSQQLTAQVQEPQLWGYLWCYMWHSSS